MQVVVHPQQRFTKNILGLKQLDHNLLGLTQIQGDYSSKSQNKCRSSRVMGPPTTADCAAAESKHMLKVSIEDGNVIRDAPTHSTSASASGSAVPQRMLQVARGLLQQSPSSSSSLGRALSPPPESESCWSPTNGAKFQRLATSNDDEDDEENDSEVDTLKHHNVSLSSSVEKYAPFDSSQESSSSNCSWRALTAVLAVAACAVPAYAAGYYRSAPNTRNTKNTQSGTKSTTTNTIGTGKYREGRDHPKVFVCITGQLPRLELRNKIHNLFLPWVEDHQVEFDVALVLTDTDHKSVNRQGERNQEYFSVREVYDELSAIEGVNVLNDGPDVQSQNPILNPYYTRQRTHDTTMTPEEALERVQNHVRQFQSLAECHRHMSMKGRPDTYDIVHRIREDSGHYDVPDLNHIHDVVSSHPMTIMSAGCQFHGGINDRGSFVSPEAAYDYFVGPILDMYVKPLPPDVRNTEQFLMVHYARTCHLVQSDAFRIFRLWEKIDDDANVEGGDADSSNAVMTFSHDDLKCLEDINVMTSRRHTENCHHYSDGYDYCVYLDKPGLTYNPGKPGLLQPVGGENVNRLSARLRVSPEDDAAMKEGD
uniref:Uncharacterized protein n=1 Tax=Odontella aurita TaxID=265563 RepID=A0A7S4J7P2_9STRA